MYLKKGVSIKLFLLASWRSLTKKAGSGSVIQRYGSEDPDSYQNVFSDPETYCLTLNRFCRSYDFTQPWRNYYLHVLPATPTFLLVARRGNFPLSSDFKTPCSPISAIPLCSPNMYFPITAKTLFCSSVFGERNAMKKTSLICYHVVFNLVTFLLKWTNGCPFDHIF